MGEYLRLHAHPRHGQGQGPDCSAAAGVTTVRELAAAQSLPAWAQNMKDINIRRKLVHVLPSEKVGGADYPESAQAAAEDHVLR